MSTTQTRKEKFRVVIDADRCKSCNLCVDYCPTQVLGMTMDRLNAKGVTFAIVVHQEKCIGCMACTLMCPDAAIELYKVEE